MSAAIRVLMVEDSEDDALLTLRELRNAGYEVEHLRVGTDLALRSALEQRTWDLITIDYNLPQMTGLDALALVRAHNTDLPVIVVSGVIGEDTAVDCMRAGADDYVMKDNLKRLGPAAARELAEVEERRAARLQRERTARIIDAADTLVVGCDPEGLITTFNRKCEKVSGWSRDDVIGRMVSKLGPDGDWITSAIDACDASREFDRVTEFEHPLVDTEGRERIITWYPTPILDDDGTLVEVVAIGMDITVQLAAERQYRTLVDTMGDGLNITDLSGRITYANEALCDMLEYDLGELIGKPITELCDDENRAILQPQMIERFESGAPAKYELNYTAKSGRQVPVLVSATALRNSADVIVGAFAVIKDMTEREQAQAALAESEERYRGLVDMLPQTVFETNAEANLTIVNQAGLAMFGYAQEDVEAGINILDVVAHEEREQAAERLAGGENSKVFAPIEYTMLRKDGSTFPGLVYWSYIIIDGEPSGMRGILIDITELKQAEAALAESEASLRTVLSAAPIGIGLLHDRVVGWVSEGLTEMLGYSEEELLGKDSRIVYEDDEEYDRVGEALYGQILRIGTGEVNTRFRHKDGNISDVFLRMGAVDREDLSAGVILTATDVTEHHQLEEQLRQAQKMEAVGQLAGGVAHDFNNLLTAILGNAELLSREVSDSEELTAFADEVLKAGRRATGLTRQLLAFSRKQVLEPEIMDLNETISELATMLRRLIEENVELVTYPGANLHMIEADAGQIEQIIVNLVVNARDAMRDGGTLTIETSNVNLDEEYVRLHWDAAVGPHVMLAISDTGTGIDANIVEHIFEPFFTTKDEGEGTGLGLATVHGIVQQSGGSINVYSEPGEGTTFRVYFPRAEEEVDAAVEEPKADSATGGEETILMVEDEEMVRELIVRIIAAQGYNVLVANNGQEALTIFESHEGPIDLMVTDVIMPGMSGDELAERARELAPDLKVIYLSGYTANAIAERGVLAPGVHLVQKPFEPDALLAKIREVIDAPADAQ